MKSTPIFILFTAAFLAGCASGPAFEAYNKTLNAPAEGESRVWFYRPSKMVGSAVQPIVYVNDEVVGRAQPGCFFHIDRKPGHELRCTTEWSDKSQLTTQTVG